VGAKKAARPLIILNMQGYFGASCRRRLASLPPRLWRPAPLRISFINGINNTKDDLRTTTRHIEDAFGHEVNAFWNATGGGYSDVWKTASMRFVTHDWPEAEGLAQHLRQCIATVGDGRVIHLAHSHGALITALAAKHLKPEEKKRIEVRTRRNPDDTIPIVIMIPSRCGFNAIDFCPLGGPNLAHISRAIQRTTLIVLFVRMLRIVASGCVHFVYIPYSGSHFWSCTIY